MEYSTSAKVFIDGNKVQTSVSVDSNGIDQRKAALDRLDNAKLGWPHIKACLVSGIGFYTDAYDLFVISLALQMIGFVYYADNKNKVPTQSEKWIKVSALVGTFIGQLVFGYLADRLGRKKMYGSELLLIVSMTVVQCFADSLPSGMTICQMLIMWRLFLGIGIGGDYPLSAIITSEFANTKNRGALMAAVFSMQGFGILTGSLVACLVLFINKNGIEGPDEIAYIDTTWRVLIGLGAVPGVVAIYFRMTIPESPRFTMDVKGDTTKATSDTYQMIVDDDAPQQYLLERSASQSSKIEVKSIRDSMKEQRDGPSITQQQNKGSLRDFKRYYSLWKNLKVLLGTSVSWFCLDVAFYGTNLNTPIILSALNLNKDTPYNLLINAAIGQMIISALGAVPGYWFTVLFVDRWGRKTIQMMGFVILTILFLVLGIWFDTIRDNSKALFFVIYSLIQFFSNFGPNSTTFIVPGEVFPTRYRSTCHGISAASGKLGAIVATLGFAEMKDYGGQDAFIPQLFIIFGVFMALGGVFTLLIPETKGISLEELAGEQ